MYRPIRWLILLLILAACRQTRSGSERGEAPDVAAGSGGAEREGSGPGLEFEAPRLVPAIRAQIIELENAEGVTEGSLAAFRNGVDTLVSAMQADLNRVGATDTAAFHALGDSVRRQIAGGPGVVISRVERLIEIYGGKMRKAGN